MAAIRQLALPDRCGIEKGLALPIATVNSRINVMIRAGKHNVEIRRRLLRAASFIKEKAL